MVCTHVKKMFVEYVSMYMFGVLVFTQRHFVKIAGQMLKFGFGVTLNMYI
jgi:hypothetical protein